MHCLNEGSGDGGPSGAGAFAVGGDSIRGSEDDSRWGERERGSGYDAIGANACSVATRRLEGSLFVASGQLTLISLSMAGARAKDPQMTLVIASMHIL